MILLFDLVATQPSSSAKFHGGGLYGEILFFSLIPKLAEGELLCLFDSKKYLNPDIEELCKTKNIILIDINNSSLERILKDYSVDVFYSSLPELYHQEKIDNCVFIGTIHGLRSLEMYIDKTAWNYSKTLKEKCIFLVRYFFKNQLLKHRVLKIWGKLFSNPNFKFIAVSEHSRFSVQTFFPMVDTSNIQVLYSPLINQIESSQIDRISVELPNQLVSQKYFLLTSGERWLKNNLRACIALDELFSENEKMSSTFKVVVTGVRHQSIYTKKIKNKEKFVFFDFVERDLLNTLHQNAYAFIYPSLNEGFGYPPLESMIYKVPVIASGISSIPEICGSAAIYFNPFCKNEIKNRILQILDDDIHVKYSNLGYARYDYIQRRQVDDLDKLVHYIMNICRSVPKH